MFAEERTATMASIKGQAVLDSIRAVRQREGEEILDRIVERMRDPWRGLFRGQLLPTAWYPLDAFASFLDADVAVTAKGDLSVLTERSTAVVDAQLGDIYQVFIRHQSPLALIRRIAMIHDTYFNGITVIVEELSPTKAIVRYSGLEKHHQTIEALIVGFYRATLMKAGAKTVTVRVIESLSTSNGRCKMQISWE